MRFRNVATVLCLIVTALILIPSRGRSSAQTERGKALESLIAAERAFSKTAEEKGIREAFLAWLAPDAVVFRPGPVKGRPVYEKMDPSNPTVLTWEPEIADVAASGELGYTSGPYRVRPRVGEEPTGFGHYVSVWKKQPDGTWKVLLDIGIQYERPSPGSPIGAVSRPPARPDFEDLSAAASRDESRVVADRATQFAARVSARGYRSALAEYATDDVRLYRPGRPPAVGRSQIKTLIPRSAGEYAPPRGVKNDTRLVNRAMFHAEISRSGDLAVTYGTSDQLKSRTSYEKVSFLKIWRKDRPADVWRICLDIEFPLPAEAEKNS